MFGGFVRNFGRVFAILFEALLIEIQEESLILLVGRGGGLVGTKIVNGYFCEQTGVPYVVFVLLKSWDAIPRMEFRILRMEFRIPRAAPRIPRNSPTESSENGLFTPRAFFLKLGWRRREKRTRPPPKENLLGNFSGPKEKLSRSVVDTKTL